MSEEPKTGLLPLSPVLKGVIEVVQEIKLKEKDFKEKEVTPGKKTGFVRAHAIVVDAIKDAWDDTDGFGIGVTYEFERLTHGIDFVGRDQSGKIAVAIEVDRWRRPTRSWIKLADVRSENKAWIFITDSKVAKKEFQGAIRQVRRLFKTRHEDITTFGKFIAVLKTPEDFDIKEIEW